MMKVSFDLSDKDLRHFRRIMSEVREKCASLPESAIISSARGLLESIRETEVPDFVRQRIEKLERLIDMLEDEEWALAGRDRERVLRGMAYFAEPEDMIPDRIPVLGYLDDAIMIELVVREMKNEIDAYEEFCTFRTREEARTGRDISREDWVASKRKELMDNMRERMTRRSRGGGRFTRFSFLG